MLPEDQIKILVADDDEDDFMLFSDALNEVKKDVIVRYARNGRELMDNLAHYSRDRDIPHLLFLDLNMPIKNGMDCLSEIKNNKIFRELKVIIFSTSSQLDAVRKAYDLGANLYLKKPDSFDKLKNALQQTLFSYYSNDLKKPHFSEFLIDLDEK